MTLADLRKKSGLSRAPLKISIVSLSRKLGGKQALHDEEIEAIARALGVDVTVRRVTVTLGKAAA